MAYLIGLVRDRFKNHINFLTLFIGILVFGVLLLDIVGTIIMGFIIHMPISKVHFYYHLHLFQEILLKDYCEFNRHNIT